MEENSKMDTSKNDLKTERIEIRVTPNVKALIIAAAVSQNTTVSDFLLNNSLEAAKQALASPRIFYASEEGWAAVQKLLDEDDKTQPDAAVIKYSDLQR